MNDYLVSGLLGVIEGLTEFLPVSSTAHLRIAEVLFHIDLSDGYWKMYSVVIQLGAVLCLPIYFRSRITTLLASFPRRHASVRRVVGHPLGLVLVACVVTTVPAFLLTRVIGQQLERLGIIGGSLLAGGVVMSIVDAWAASAERRGPHGRPGHIRTWVMDEMSLVQAVWIGGCQILSAVFPGTSRSMATIAAGQVAGMSRAAALEFSFFLSIPTMFAATGYSLLHSLRGEGTNSLGVSHIDAHGWWVLGIGFTVSFAVAYASVAWFTAYVRRRGFWPFAVYRIALGAFVLLWFHH